MAQLQTEGLVQGETDEKSELLSIKQYLEKEQLSEIYPKLESHGMHNLDIFLFMEPNEMNELCKLINLDFVTSMKFKTAIRKLQDSRHKTQQNIIAITMKEQNEIDKILFLLNQCNDIQSIFEKHFIEIDENVINIKGEINTKFIEIHKKLEIQKQNLFKQIDEWKLKKLQIINQETENINKYKKDLNIMKNECNKLLNTKEKISVNERQKTIIKMVNKNQKFIHSSDLLEYIHKNTQLMCANISDIINIDNIINISSKESQLFTSQIPILLLCKPIKTKKK
eukprot:458746_1